MNTTTEANSSSQPKAKSIFASKTFWGAMLAGVAAIVPIAVKDIKEQHFSIDDAGQVVLILCGVGTAVVGRINAELPVYTPNGIPGPDKSDLTSQK